MIINNTEKQTCVPGVVAGGPWQVPREGEGQIKDSPGQNDYVIDIQQGYYDLGGITNTCS